MTKVIRATGSLLTLLFLLTHSVHERVGLGLFVPFFDPLFAPLPPGAPPTGVPTPLVLAGLPSLEKSTAAEVPV